MIVEGKEKGGDSVIGVKVAYGCVVAQKVRKWGHSVKG